MSEEKIESLKNLVEMYSKEEPKLMIPQVNFWVAVELVRILLQENEKLKETIATYTDVK
jgi:predicted nucleic-acid-binding protein